MRKRLYSVAVTVPVLALCFGTMGAGYQDHVSRWMRFAISGSWEGEVQITAPGNPTMQELLTFTPTGAVVESHRLYVPDSPFGSMIETAGHGSWKRKSLRTFDISFQWIIEGGPGNPYYEGQFIGYDKVSWDATLDEDGMTLSGPARSQLVTLDGEILFSAEAYMVLRRLPVEPLQD